MRIVAVTLMLLGCMPLPVPAPGEPPPVYTPRPIPPAKIEPIETPKPMPAVSYPEKVTANEPFVVTYCGPRFEQQVSIRLDNKWDAGGLMGWTNECKTQTVSLNTKGLRFMQFVVDGDQEIITHAINVE